MNCPSCGAPMHPHGDTLVCDFCHNVVVPDTNDDGVIVLDEAPGQSCPICSNLPLMQATLAKLPLLYCTKCRGMLVSMGRWHLGQLMRRLRSPGSMGG